MEGGAAQLTPGGVRAIAGGALPSEIQPVLQMLQVRLALSPKSEGATSASPNPSERYRVVLSDGVDSHQAILSTDINPLVRDGALRVGTIVHLNEFICNTIHDKRIIIVLELEILQTECAIIGSPKNYAAQNLEMVQDPNLSANAARKNSGICPGGPGMLGSSVAPRAEQASNNLSYGVPYNGAQGIGRTVEPDPNDGRTVVPDHNNMFTGGSYDTVSAQNTVNTSMMEPRSNQPSLRSYHNQQFAVNGTGEALTPPGNTYGHPEQPSCQQLPPVYINRAPVTRNESTSHIVPINSLNPYQHPRWTIKARVTAKTAVKHWNKANSTGKVFSFDLLDGEGGEIRAVCFKEAVDKFYDLIEVGKVYFISRGSVRHANKQYNALNNNNEITLDASTSSVEICSSDDYNIPRVQYNFRQISEIENMGNQTVVDLLGVVTSVGPSDMIMMRKSGTEAQKRTLQLRDMSGRSVQVTFWGNFCDSEGQQLQLQCDSGLNPILALVGARISDFSGRSVNTTSSTQIKIDPDFPDAEKLKRWYITEGKNAACVSLSREQSNSVQAVRKTIAQIGDENLGRDKTDWITVKAAISHVYTDSFCYPACPLIFNEKPCNKKVIDSGDGMWLCEKCDKSFGNCEYRYAVKFHIQDHTGTIYVTAFQEVGEQIFGCTAQELHTVRNNDDDTQFTEIIEGARWHLNLFKLNIREESFNDEPRVQCKIVNAEKLDPSKESRILSEAIGNLLQDGSAPSIPGDQSNITANTGFSNSPGGHNALTSSSSYGMNMGGINQFGQQVSIVGGTSAPCTGMDRPQQPGGGGYGSAGSNVRLDLCFNCNKPGHYSRDCPEKAAAPKQQAYGNGPASGGLTGGNYGSSAAGSSRPGPCFKCNQPGHWARECPGR